MRSLRQFSFLTGPNFVRIDGSTITCLVDPPYPDCLLVAFVVLVLFCAFCAFGVQNLFVKKDEEFQTALKLSGQF